MRQRNLKLRAMPVTVNNIQTAPMPAHQIGHDFKSQAGAVGTSDAAHMRHQQITALGTGQTGAGIADPN